MTQFSQVGCVRTRRTPLSYAFGLQYCEILKNTHFEKHLWTAASENLHVSNKFTEGR